jgi:hypothetical protein
MGCREQVTSPLSGLYTLTGDVLGQLMARMVWDILVLSLSSRML